jgi:hypothetical protein
MSTPLGDALVPGQATRSSDRSGAPGTRLYGRRLILARVAWVAMATLIVAAFFAMLPAYYTLLSTVCESAMCADWQPNPASALAIQNLGFSIGTFATFTVALTIVSAFICFAFGAVIFWRKSDDWMALLVALGVVALGTASLSSVIQSSHSTWQALAIVMNVLGHGVFFLACSLFPNGRYVPRWTRWLVPCWVASGLIFLYFRDVSLAFQVHTLVFLGVIVLLLIAQVYRFHYASSPLQRQQTKWVISGLSVAGIIVVVLKVPTLLFTSLGQAGSLYQLLSGTALIIVVLIFPLSIGIAILRYRLWDIDLIIRRTLIYSTLTIVLAAVYEVSVFTLQVFTSGLALVRGNQLAIFVSTLLIGLLFKPVHDRSRGLIDRRFYRRKYDAAQTVAAFSATIRDEVDLNQFEWRNQWTIQLIFRANKRQTAALWLVV